MRLLFPRIGLFQLGMKKKNPDLNKRPNQSRLACLQQRNSRPPVHPEDEPIPWWHFMFLNWHQWQLFSRNALISHTSLCATVCVQVAGSTRGQLQLDDIYVILKMFFLQCRNDSCSSQVPQPDSRDTVWSVCPLPNTVLWGEKYWTNGTFFFLLPGLTWRSNTHE